MRYKLLIYVLLAVGTALLIAGSVSALEPERITDDVHSQESIDMSSRYIVWMDYRHGDTEIYAYDIVGTNGVVRVSFDSANDDEMPKVDSDRVVWRSRDDWSGHYRVFYKNITTGQTHIVCNVTDWIDYYNIGDDYILFSYGHWVSGGMESYVYKYRISSQSSTNVYQTFFSDWGSISSFDILGTKAIFIVRDNNNLQLVHFDLLNDQVLKTIAIPSNTGECGFSSNSLLVCSSWSGGAYTMNLNTQQFQGIDLGVTLGESDLYRVSGNNLVYMNITTDVFGYDLFLYRLDTKETVRLTYSPTSPEFYFAVSGDMVAYISSENIFPDVYLLKLSTDPPDLSISRNDLILNPSFPVVGEPCRLNVVVHNIGRNDADAKVDVVFKTSYSSPITMVQSSGTIMKGGWFMVMFNDITFIKPGYYSMSVKVTHRDLSGQQVPEMNLENNHLELVIYVNDKPLPIIEPPEAISVETYEPVELVGKKSFDPDGITVYSWDFGDGGGAVGPLVTHSWVDDGSYTVTLTVYDIYGAKNSTTKVVNVTNRAPEAVWNVPEILPRGKEVILSAVGSNDKDGTVSLVSWSIPGEPEQLEGFFVTYIFTQEDQVVTIYLNVTDDDGAITTVPIQVELVDEDAKNIPPVAVITVTGTGGNLTLSAIGSFDPNGVIEKFEWTFDDGSKATGDKVTKMFSEGDHFITLNIEDDEGLTDTAVVAVTISYTEPPDIIQEVYGNTTVVNRIEGNEAPSATASYDITDNKTGAVSFTGTGLDPDGNITKYEWDFDGDGTWDHSSPTSGSATHTYTKPGFYTVIFRVTDDNGTSAVSVLSVAIKTDEIGKTEVKQDSEAGGVDMMMLIILIVVAIVVAAVVAIVAAKKFSSSEIDIATQAEVNELQRLVEESKATGANVDEAEAIIRELEGR